MPKRTTKGIDLPDNVILDVLSNALPIGSCKPTELFKIDRATKAGVTASWTTIAKHKHILTEVLDVSHGRVLNQNNWHTQLRVFLQKSGMSWSLVDTERAEYHFRIMMQKLLNTKRSGRLPPKQFGQLAVLVEKMYISDDEVLTFLKLHLR